MRNILFVILFLITSVSVYASSLMLTATPNTYNGALLTTTQTNIEKYFVIQQQQINSTTWNIVLTMDPDLRNDLTLCLGKLNGSNSTATCDIPTLRAKWFSDTTFTNTQLSSIFANITRQPVNSTTMNKATLSTINYLAETNTFQVIYNTPGSITIGSGTLTLGLPVNATSRTDVGRLTENTFTFVSEQNINASCYGDINATDTKYCNTRGNGTETQDAYFLTNFSTPPIVGTPTSIFITATMIGTNLTDDCQLAIYNYTLNAFNVTSNSWCIGDVADVDVVIAAGSVAHDTFRSVDVVRSTVGNP